MLKFSVPPRGSTRVSALVQKIGRKAWNEIDPTELRETLFILNRDSVANLDAPRILPFDKDARPDTAAEARAALDDLFAALKGAPRGTSKSFDKEFLPQLFQPLFEEAKLVLGCWREATVSDGVVTTESVVQKRLMRSDPTLDQVSARKAALALLRRFKSMVKANPSEAMLRRALRRELKMTARDRPRAHAAART